MKTEEHHRIAKEGTPFILVLALMVLLGGFLHPLIGALCFILLVFVIYFFRNPKRSVPDMPGVLAPADGRVIHVGEVQEERYLKDRVKKISIFMSPLNVHVNRIPVDGTIKGIFYNTGKYFRAFAEKASLDNEQNAILMEASDGGRILFVQIAGFLARRIVCYARPNEDWKRGAIFGMIRFGSRMDVYVPLQYEILVKNGDHVRAGETLLARK